MIYLTKGHKVVVIQEGTDIERVGNIIKVIMPVEDSEFVFDSESEAIIAFNHILERLNNYSPAYGINI